MNRLSVSDPRAVAQYEPVKQPVDGVSSVGVEFLARLAGDRITGCETALTEYLAEFPGYEREIVRAWLELGEPERDGEGLDGDQGAAPPTLGTIGPYRLERELGRGAQGVVWLAEDTRIGRRVALKTAARSPLFASLGPRLEREAQALARLQHPGLCVVFDVGATDSVAWIAMRYEPGRTLAERIANGETAQRTGAEIVGWFEQAARALDAAHAAGFLHRDVKPSNLIVREDGVVVVLDFGVAANDADGAPITLTGDLVGTPAYMAPEQLATSHGKLDRRADVWALGVSLYEALVGTRPFTAPTREDEARRALHEDPFPLPRAALRELPRRDLETVLATALAKEPQHRYASAAALADDLARLRSGEAPLARRPGPLLRAARWARRRPGLAAALATLVVFALATAWLLAQSRTQLSDIRRLADLETAQRLIAARGTLFPLTPETAARAQAWLDGAAEVLARRSLHEGQLATVPESDVHGWSDRGAAASQWHRAQLVALLARFDELEKHSARLAPRVDLARDLARITLHERAADWTAAAERVRRDARFAVHADFELRPQLGLVPLGPDPASGLEEFAHIQSGRLPQRAMETGALVVQEGMCVVLVLVPFGETTVGVSFPDENGPNPDPLRARWDGPPQTVRLDPFFISKYEFTRGQWESQTGQQGGYYGARSDVMLDSAPLHPAEYFSDEVARTVLTELGLELPTEVQWEHAARAGTTTPWSFGDDPLAAGAFANIADQSAFERQPEVGWKFTRGVRDGYAFHAPVGRLAPNPWGLHDVHGNVRELTSSTWEDWEEFPPMDGTGATKSKYDMFTVRGGSFDRNVEASRSSLRDGTPRRIPTASLGVRPSRSYAP